jgi:hypothetical protein
MHYFNIFILFIQLLMLEVMDTAVNKIDNYSHDKQQGQYQGYKTCLGQFSVFHFDPIIDLSAIERK